MSYQHFYSRVPSRVSLFNKRDGFDTFAHSAVLDRDFILGELSTVYADKLNIHHPLKIRRGEIPTVYSQIKLPSGSLVQTSIKYIPSDFTGERSAYFAHSLVLTEEEVSTVIKDTSVDVFNEKMFITDISGFNLTNARAMANPAYPETKYHTKKIADHKNFVSSFNEEMFKSLIFSVISSICPDGREVYVRLPVEDSSVSEEGLRLINAIMSILPYSIRERISFVSYVSTPEAYADFRLKCVSSSFSGIEPERGVFYDFTDNSVTGQPANLDRQAALTSFLYSLFEYNAIREGFLEFVENIEEEYDFRISDISTFREIAFVYWQCSGYFVEDSVVPTDDSISNLFDVYAKYREGLSVEHRTQIFRCLKRYSDAQIAIPDSVFSRLSTLYPGECVEAKAVALDVLLNLIHVDLMRDSLFCFISRNYHKETDGVKAVIISNLCRVFYGGFLQQNILGFFDAHFRREPAHTKDIILDKLLLSIRTPEVYGQIVFFLDRHYSALNDEQKLKICSTCFEMLPECDDLSVQLIGLINRRMGKDKANISTTMRDGLTALLAATLENGDARLAAMFVENPGFCENVVMRYAMSAAHGSETVIGLLTAMPAHVRIDKLISAYENAEPALVPYYVPLINRIASIPVAVWPSTLREIFDRDAKAEEKLPQEWILHFRRMIIYPAVFFTIFQFFGGDSGVTADEIVAYGEKNPNVAESAEYKVITNYLALVNKCNMSDIEGAFKIISSLPAIPELRSDISDYMRATAYKPKTFDNETSLTYDLVMRYLSDGEFDFEKIYLKYSELFMEDYLERGGFAAKKADRKGACDAAEMIISAVSEICEVSDELADKVMDEESGFISALRTFVDFYGYGLGATTVLKKYAKDAYYEIDEIIDDIAEECRNV